MILQHVTFSHEIPTCDDPKHLALYIRCQTTNERTFHKCFNELLKLRAEKRKQEIGFESQQHKQAEHVVANRPKTAAKNAIAGTFYSPKPSSITSCSRIPRQFIQSPERSDGFSQPKTLHERVGNLAIAPGL